MVSLREERYILVVVVMCSCVVNPAVGAANLDSKEPIIKISPGDPATDEFGYGVLLHRIASPLTNSFQSYLNSTRLVVGAPRGTYPGGLSLPLEDTAENNTGLVYQCPIGQGQCVGVGNADSPLFDKAANDGMENKTGQLMGSVLYSEGNYFIACAPLYVIFSVLGVQNLDDSRPVGRCFVSPRDLQSFYELRPCAGDGSSDPKATIRTNQQCLSGFSTTILNANSSTSTVIVAAPGSKSFDGNLFYFGANSSSGILTSQTANDGINETMRYQYEGFSSTIGDITGINSQDIITGVPRSDGTTLFGGVRVRQNTDRDGIATINIRGFQTGEYFGASVVAADLNNDGYDELIVGAPIYSSRMRQESGRVYIYRNIGGALNDTPIILEGPSVQSRFGSSIVNLGDINGDDLEDIAIGAPFEAVSESDEKISGKVYIHYGNNSGDAIISTIANQVLSAQDVVRTIPDVTSLEGFGFSLSSGVDVDGNEFNDLLVGAQISGAAVLFRSLSIANIEIVSITSSSKTILLDTIGTAGTPFTVRICARYSGRGLNGRPLTVNYRIGEVTDGPSRIYFNPESSEANFALSEFTFITTDTPSCEDVVVYSKALANLTRSSLDLLSPIVIQVSFFGLDRPTPTYIDGSPQQLDDYRDTPLVLVEGNNSISVFPSVNCSGRSNGEESCISDLIVILNDTVFLTSNGTTIERGVAVAGLVQNVRVDLTYENIGRDPALGSEIQFTLPEGFFYTSAIAPGEEVSCQEDSTISRLYGCRLPNYIPPQDQSSNDVNTRLTLFWRIEGGALVGNEETQTSNISIRLIPSDGSSDMESNTSNNNLINGPVRIVYEAVADLDISSLVFSLTVANYRRTTVKSNPTITEIGRTVQLQFRAVNRGPSNSPNTRVEVYIPTNDTLHQFYLYVTNATAMFANGTPLADCDFGGINPQKLPSPSNNRRKRSIQKRQDQATTEAITSLPDVIRNCSDPELRANRTCTAIKCNIPNFMISPSVEIVVTAALDDRFFNTVRAPYTFVAYGRVYTNSSFVIDPDLSNNQNITEGYRVTMFVPPETVSFPFWIIIVIGVVFIIILIIVFIILYCLGCFRRKRHKDFDGEEVATSSVKVTAINPETENGLGEEKKPSDSPQSIKKADYDVSDEIGDASDLQMDNDPDVPVKDSDETSL